MLHFDLTTNQSEFKKIRNIGKGGYGLVAEFLHIPTNTHLAGKIIKPEVLEDEDAKTLRSEIAVLEETSSPYTVSYYGTVLIDGNYVIMMDFCDRGSLRDIIDDKGKALTELQISFVMNDLLEALKLLHHKQIIHRDIKAANILVTSKGVTKVTDFGVSRQFSPNAVTFSTMSVIGTPYWMAPEVIDAQKYSFPADIWSVGASAVELAEGGPPYCEFPPTRAMVEISVHGFPGFRNSSVLSDCFQDFVSRCMIINPAKRPKPEELLQHPFVRQMDEYDREAVFYPLVKDEVDFDKLLEDEYDYDYDDYEEDENDLIPNLNEMKGESVQYEKSPVVNNETIRKVGKTKVKTKVEKKPGYETFISKCQPGAALDDIFTKPQVFVNIPPPPKVPPPPPPPRVRPNKDEEVDDVEKKYSNNLDIIRKNKLIFFAMAIVIALVFLMKGSVVMFLMFLIFGAVIWFIK
ncbi:STE family protein kinase [Histomonas meleagridis]|uniref:STE family protein kinase n=1 Tax=Histomonas meleagridis TaxID=135588 RepID=UPI00355A0AB1|nr:STE family protein kinase [Histomonas meleagridis]KAH0804151.1 STE family protein kinase [Histomonas meleagridis]